jgi:hypothetical protein
VCAHTHMYVYAYEDIVSIPVYVWPSLGDNVLLSGDKCLLTSGLRLALCWSAESA